MRRPLPAAAALVAAAVVALTPSAAQAHSLQSSMVSAHVTDAGVDATVTITLATGPRP